MVILRSVINQHSNVQVLKVIVPITDIVLSDYL